MSQAAHAQNRLIVPKRDKTVVFRPRPTLGDHETQVKNAFATSFERYEKAYEELAKI
ncbi:MULTISPECIES: hypothetical protein [Pseudomonadaceae]|uniref:Uncharacterized protein n=1 Tax=Ectopseudomonas oleovorans TaxID=301 RepID=A0A3D9E909_ECTOL|nr:MULTISPECIES: hypothetical protein [Pseudomonas]REC98894.1 hypothetical protein DFO60_4848 [Pseudomonas oleovorans]